MECVEAREEFSALLDGELAAEERTALEAHLAQCSECLRELDKVKRVNAMYRGLSLQRAPEGFEERVRGALRPRAVKFRRPRPERARVWPLLLAAATLLVVLGGALFQISRTSQLFRMAAPEATKADQRLMAKAAAPESKAGIPESVREQMTALGYLGKESEKLAERAASSAPPPAQPTPEAPPATPPSAPAPKAAAAAPPEEKPATPPATPGVAGGIGGAAVGSNLPEKPAPQPKPAADKTADRAVKEKVTQKGTEAQAQVRVSQPRQMSAEKALAAGDTGVKQSARRPGTRLVAPPLAEEFDESAEEVVLAPPERTVAPARPAATATAPAFTPPTPAPPPTPSAPAAPPLSPSLRAGAIATEPAAAPALPPVESVPGVPTGKSQPERALRGNEPASRAISSETRDFGVQSAPPKAAPDKTETMVRMAAGERFALQDGIWTQAGYKGQKTVPLTPGSVELRNLTEQHKKLSEILALGGRVIFKIGGAWYKVEPPAAQR
jgi:anti-sigma factor (TIGR02949 family)